MSGNYDHMVVITRHFFNGAEKFQTLIGILYSNTLKITMQKKLKFTILKASGNYDHFAKSLLFWVSISTGCHTHIF